MLRWSAIVNLDGPVATIPDSDSPRLSPNLSICAGHKRTWGSPHPGPRKRHPRGIDSIESSSDYAPTNRLRAASKFRRHDTSQLRANSLTNIRRSERPRHSPQKLSRRDIATRTRTEKRGLLHRPKPVRKHKDHASQRSPHGRVRFGFVASRKCQLNPYFCLIPLILTSS
jgi:hypothetical protein